MSRSEKQGSNMSCTFDACNFKDAGYRHSHKISAPGSTQQSINQVRNDRHTF